LFQIVVIGNIPVGQWFPNNITGKIRIRRKKLNTFECYGAYTLKFDSESMQISRSETINCKGETKYGSYLPRITWETWETWETIK
jgi:hypothetical protein